MTHGTNAKRSASEAPDVERRRPRLLAGEPLVVEQLALGEAPAGSEASLARALPDLPDRLEALERSNREVLTRYAPHEVAAAVQNRLSTPEPGPAAISIVPRRRAWWWDWRFAGPMAVMAVALLVVAVRPSIVGTGVDVDGGTSWSDEAAGGSGVTLPGDDGLRSKGLQPTLMAYRHSPNGDEKLGQSASVREADVIQLRFQAAGHRFGVILSVDGRGAVTQHLPADPNRHEAAALKPSGSQDVPDAYELDDAPRFERFVLVTGHEAFDPREVRAAVDALAADARLRESGELRLGEGLTQTWLLLRKVTR